MILVKTGKKGPKCREVISFVVKHPQQILIQAPGPISISYIEVYISL